MVKQGASPSFYKAFLVNIERKERPLSKMAASDAIKENPLATRKEMNDFLAKSA